MEAESSDLNYKSQYEELLAEKTKIESEFGQKRAQFRQIYLDCEAQLKNEKELNRQLHIQVEDLTKKNEAFKSDNEGIRIAAQFSEESKQEEFAQLRAKHQEEIASLQTIWQEASKESQTRLAKEFEEERRKLIEANTKLEQRLRQEHRSSEEASSKSGEGLMSMMTNAFSKKTSTSSIPQPQPVKGIEGPAVTLEGDQMLVKQDVDAWKGVIGPLEQENVKLQKEIKELQNQLSEIQRKLDEKNKAVENYNTSVENSEKYKEVKKYLEAERSARTDLEMYVAVLNTQKGVLQEDADKLKRELHNVCRLFEQEKMSHTELKQTWKLANEQFLEQQNNLAFENDKMKNMLTSQQLEHLSRDVRQERENIKANSQPTTPSSDVVDGTFNDLLTFDGNKSNNAEQQQKYQQPRTDRLVRTTRKKLTPNAARKQMSNTPPQKKKLSDQIFNSFFPAASQAIEILQADTSTMNEKPLMLSSSSDSESDDDLEAAILRQNMNKHEIDVIEKGEDIIETTENVTPTKQLVKKSNSTDNILNIANQTPQNLNEKSLSQGDVSWTSSMMSKSQSYNDEIDSKLSLNETGWSSTGDDYGHTCMMCQNYEKQLQRLQKEFMSIKEKESSLNDIIRQTQEELSSEKDKLQSLTQSMESAAGDTTSQFNIYKTNQLEVDKQVDNLRTQFQQFQNNMLNEVKKLSEERDHIVAQYTSLEMECAEIKSQTNNDQDVVGLQNDFEKMKTESQAAEEKLKGEIMFLKDRAFAEQFDRESTESVLQQDLDQARQELVRLQHQLLNNEQQKLTQDDKET